MDKWLKLNELIYKVPNLLVRCVEDMRTVFMNEDIAVIFAVAVSARMVSAVNHKHTLTRLMGTMRHDSTVESGTDYEKVIFECRIQNAKFKIILLAFSHWPLAISFFLIIVIPSE